MESWITLGNLIISAGIINVTRHSYDFPVESIIEIEQEYIGEAEIEQEYIGEYNEE